VRPIARSLRGWSGEATNLAETQTGSERVRNRTKMRLRPGWLAVSRVRFYGKRMANLELGQDRLAQPHPLRAFELA